MSEQPAARPRVFITGCNGQLGRDCGEVLAPRCDVAGADLPAIDITSAASVRGALDPFRPSVIVNCAAYTQVDAAEKDRDLARAVNALGPRVLADYAAAHGARLVHISTDYVFDGRKPPPAPYRESDPPGPLGHYGVTKLEGEEAIRASAARHVILRTAWLYGRNGRNFLKTILKLALTPRDKPLRVVNDQFGCPTWSRRLAEQIAEVIYRDAPTGTYHATGQGHCTWFEFASAFLADMGVNCRIEPCTAAEYPTAAVRPLNSILDNAGLRERGLLVMRDWREDLAEFVRRHRGELLAEVTQRPPQA